MTDIEITRLCADAMGIEVIEDGPQSEPPERWLYESGLGEWTEYEPLHNDAEAMALVKRFWLDIRAYFGWQPENNSWEVRGTLSGWEATKKSDLNRAICECVAKMQKAK